MSSRKTSKEFFQKLDEEDKKYLKTLLLYDEPKESNMDFADLICTKLKNCTDYL